jgi:hypothetical protein
MPNSRRKRPRTGATAAPDEEEASDADLGPSQATGRSAPKQKAKDAAAAETAAEIARAEVESLVDEAAAGAQKIPPPPANEAPERSDKERTNQERIRVMEQNRKEKEAKDARDKHAAELQRLEEQNRMLRQQLKKNKSKAHSSEPTTPKRRRSNSATREKKVNAIFDMWILPPTTSDCLKCTVQAKKIRAFVADNMFERFNSQTVTRPLMRFAVHLLVSRLGPHFHYSSNKSTVSAIIETVVVERNLGGITSREDYIELRDASREAETVFFSKLQGTLQKNLTGLRKNVRDMVVKFFEYNVDDPMIEFVKEHVFGRDPKLPLLSKTHHELGTCFDVPCPSWKGTLLFFKFVNESSPPHPT